MKEEKDWKKEFIIEKLKELTTYCPECSNVKNNDYKCPTCHCEGGDGEINVFTYLKENKDILN